MQTKINYQAWQIDVATFPAAGSLHDQLAFLLQFAVLAPSSHNSQPWKFQCHDATIVVAIDNTRSLPISDVNHRQLIMSIGCAIQNIIIAADYFSIPLTVAYFSEGENSQIIASITAQQGTGLAKHDPQHAVHFIAQRRTNRNKYDRRRFPSEQFFQTMTNCASDGVRVHIITDRAQKERITDVVIEAGIDAMNSSGFRKELSHYLISNVSDKGTGMPGFTIGMPTPLSLFIPWLIQYVNFARLNKPQDRALLKEYTPVFCIITTKEDTPKSWVRVGECFERIALAAEQEGLATAPLAAAIQIGDHYRKLQQILNTTDRPQFFFRLGYPLKPARHSPRLPAHAVTEV